MGDAQRCRNLVWYSLVGAGKSGSTKFPTAIPITGSIQASQAVQPDDSLASSLHATKTEVAAIGAETLIDGKVFALHANQGGWFFVSDITHSAAAIAFAVAGRFDGYVAVGDWLFVLVLVAKGRQCGRQLTGGDCRCSQSEHSVPQERPAICRSLGSSVTTDDLLGRFTRSITEDRSPPLQPRASDDRFQVSPSELRQLDFH